MTETTTCIGCGIRIPPEFDACEACAMGPFADAPAIDRDRDYAWLHSDALGAVAIPEDDPRPMAEQWAGAAAEAFDSPEDSRCADPACDVSGCLG
jgi:hypothetical protein